MICHVLIKNHKYACVYTRMIFLMIFYMYNFPWDLHNSNNSSGPLSVRNLCKICAFLSFARAAFSITKSDWFLMINHRKLNMSDFLKVVND